MIQTQLGDYEGGRLAFEAALASIERRYGVGHPNAAGAYNNLAVIHISRDEIDEAIVSVTPALELDRQVFGPRTRA